MYLPIQISYLNSKIRKTRTVRLMFRLDNINLFCNKNPEVLNDKYCPLCVQIHMKMRHLNCIFKNCFSIRRAQPSRAHPTHVPNDMPSQNPGEKPDYVYINIYILVYSTNSVRIICMFHISLPCL